MTRLAHRQVSTYRYNPGCGCDWCANAGAVPQGTADNGHGFGYEIPHNPPPDTTVNLIALLSFYDEPPEWLDRMVRSLQRLHVTRLVALDGAYELYPNGKASSPQHCRDALTQAADATGVHLHLTSPPQPWSGNEIQKRNALFALAEQHATPGDWYLVIDADEHILEAPPEARLGLRYTPFDVAGVTLHEPGHPLGTIVFDTFPMLFKAIPGLRCQGNHYTYTTPDGRTLWGNAKTDRLEPRHDLTSVIVEHTNQLRHTDRRKAALTYYIRRDQAGIEDIPPDRHLIADAA